MSTFHEEAAMAHGAANPKWKVAFIDGAGKPVSLVVGAADKREAVNTAVQRLEMDLSREQGLLQLQECIQQMVGEGAGSPSMGTAGGSR